MAFTLKACLLILFVVLRSDAHEVCIVPKCCPLNQSLLEATRGCQNSSLKFEPDFWNGSQMVTGGETDPLNIIVGNPCQFGKFRLEPQVDSHDEFHVFCNGSLLVPFQSEQLFSLNQYCMESFTLESLGTVTLPLVCLPEPPTPPTFTEKLAMAVYPVGLLISVPFLILTIIVFLGIPELRDTQGKSLSCHCASLAVAFLVLAILQLAGDKLPPYCCVTLAFVVQFSFVSCFFWLNVMCIDTWWRLTRKPCWSSQQERKRFLFYSLYAWSVPLAFALITMVMELTPIVPNAYLKPNFGVKSCWFHSSKASFPYFYAPIGLLLVINVGLFWLSVGAVREALGQRAEEEVGLNVERDPCVYSKASRRIELFKHSLILFVVMGLNWVLELLSHFVGGPLEVWILTDTLNTMQGLIIYFVFIVSVPRVKYLASIRLMPDLSLFLWGS